MDLKKLYELFFDEKKCIEFLFEKNILKPKTNCNTCNSKTKHVDKIYKYNNCNTTVTIFKESIFSNCNIKCCDILFIGYLWLCKLNYTSINMMTTYSLVTIIKFINLFRDRAINSLTADDFVIGEKNIICEVDESKFKKYEDFWIVGGIEHTEKKKCFFVLTDNREATTLRSIIKQHVKERSIIHTDKWHGYSHLESLNMKHRRVNHSKNRIERGTGVHTNNIEELWNGVKLNIKSRNCKRNLIEKHLKEFV